MNECKCGCGQLIPLKRYFVPGHDLKALNARAARFGGTAGFIDWIDSESDRLRAEYRRGYDQGYSDGKEDWSQE